MQRFLFILLIFFVASPVLAQDPVISLNITVRDDDSGKKLGGAKIIVKSGGSVFTTKTSASNGKVPVIDLPLNQNYTVIIQKEGYVSKIATIDGHYDYPEDLPPFIPFNMESSIFQKVDGVDFSFLETTPVVKFQLDQYGNQTWDQGALKDMLKKIEELKEQLAKKKEEEEQKRKDFEAYVATGDKANEKQDYVTAIENYDKALALFDEPEVKKKRDDAQKALDAQKEADQKQKLFEQKMEEAKNAYTAKNYDKALTLYKEASGIKPEESLPKERITEIEKLLADQKAQEEKFNKFVAEADAAMGKEEYDDAILSYESALQIKEDATVKTKLENAKKKKEEKEAEELAAKEKEEKYNQLITDADKAMDSQSLEDAKTKYEEALKLKPNESYPAAQISKIDDILKKQKEEEDAAKKLEADYKKFIDEGDVAFNSGKWDDAVKKYEEALKLKPGEKYPTDQIVKARENKEGEAAQKELDDKYNKLMAEGKSLADAKKYQEAINKYTDAKSLKPEENEPKEKIAELEKKLAELANEQEKEEKYNQLMTEGKELQSAEQYADALEKYESALNVKPDDSAAKSKVEEIKKLLADQQAAQEQEKKFKEFVEAGNKDFTSQNFESAKSNYQKALAIKEDAEIRKKIADIDTVLAKNAEEADIQARYDAAIKQADDAFAAKKWEDALKKYEEALTYKDDPHPKQRIATIKEKLGELENEQAKEQQFKDLVAEGDQLGAQNEYDEAISKYEEAIRIKADITVSEKINALKKKKEEEAKDAIAEEQYKKKIAEADAAFDKREWDKAKGLYADAIDIKDVQYPKDQIAEIERLMKEESVDEVEEQYQKIIEKADQLRDEEKFEEAISYYERAKNLKSADPYPEQQIKSIEEKIAQRKKAEALDKEYNELISSADKDLGNKDYNSALEKYRKASNLKPSEEYPKNKIKEINDLISQLESDNQLQAKYIAAIKKADDLFNLGSYKEAKTAYQDASEIKPDEQYPRDRMELCDEKMKEKSENELEAEYQEILTAAKKKLDSKEYDRAIEYYKEAKGIRPSDPFPQEQIDKINKIKEEIEAKKALDEKYRVAVEKADKIFSEGDYVEAKSAYQDALEIKPEQSYPKDQIKKCDERMQAESVDEEEEQYQKILTAARKKFDEEDYEEAIGYYERALKIRPSDPFPKEQISQIRKLIEDKKATEELNARYQSAIDKADALFNAADYKEAKTAYQDALSIKGTEKYPRDQIVLCEERMKEESVNEVQEQYEKLLAAAQKKFDEKDYEKSLSYYERARDLQPSDPLPKQRIDEINQILDDLAEEKAKRDRYNKLIQQADNHFEKSEWKKALETYMDALDVFVEQYPQDQVDKCREYMKEKDTGNEQYEKLIGKADEYFDAENYEKAKNLYKRALSIKPSDKHPKNRLKEIEAILNPPQDIVAKSKDLNDYGNRVNETPVDIEAMLLEAREQANEFEIQKIYQQREDAQDSLVSWTAQGEDETFVSKHAADQIEEDISDAAWTGEERRQEATQEVEEWRTDIIEEHNERVITQEDDVQFQNRKVEAMEQDIIDNQFENDKAREQYEEDVERIKVETSDKIRNETDNQVDVIQTEKEDIDEMVEEFHVNDANNDIKRQNAVVEVEDMNVRIINRENEDIWNQEDRVMETKDDVNNMEEDIIANNLDSDNKRVEHVVVVEEQTTAYENNIKENADEQIDKNMKTNEQKEEMVQDIINNDLESDYDRLETVDKVEEHIETVDNRLKEDTDRQIDNNMNTKVQQENMVTEIINNNLNSDNDRLEVVDDVEAQTEAHRERQKEQVLDQEDENFEVVNEVDNLVEDIDEAKKESDLERQKVEVQVETEKTEFFQETEQREDHQLENIHKTDGEVENMEEDIVEHNKEMSEDHEGYEKEVVKINDEITDYNKVLVDENTDNGLEAKDYTETMIDQQVEDKRKMNENSDQQADRNLEAIEDHIEHINDKEETNNEGLILSESTIEEQKDIVNTEPEGIEVENELGQKYPEGVTEESFTINDSRGLMKAYVIRRIVVKNGTGVVYEKTQTRYGSITYTRDGEPISEYQWSDETSSADTTRN